jgi:hypothetical protein
VRVPAVRIVACLIVMLGVARAEGELDPFDAAHGSNERGSQLFDKGRELLEQKRIEEACAQFDESWRIERALGTQLNLANCREWQGRLLEAYELFEGASKQAEAQGDEMRAAFALRRAHLLEHMLARITINLATPIVKGTIVTIDGEVVPTEAKVDRRVDARKLVVAATGPTGVLSSATLTLGPGEGAIVDVPTLEERPRRLKKNRLLWGAAITALGIVTIIYVDPWVGAVPTTIGVATMLMTETARGPVVAKPRVTTVPREPK